MFYRTTSLSFQSLPFPSQRVRGLERESEREIQGVSSERASKAEVWKWNELPPTLTLSETLTVQGLAERTTGISPQVITCPDQGHLTRGIFLHPTAKESAPNYMRTHAHTHTHTHTHTFLCLMFTLHFYTDSHIVQNI